MTYSMTGYGKSSLNLENSNFIIELKSLNSKQIDINIKIPNLYRDKEVSIRNLLSKKLQRGKIELSIWKETSQIQPNYNLNKKLIKHYHQQIVSLKKYLGLRWNLFTLTPFTTKSTDILPTLLKMPDILKKIDTKPNEHEWGEIYDNINIAIEELLQFRLDEGKKLANDIILRISKIKELLKEITPFEKERIQKVKDRLHQKLSDLSNQQIDNIRFEQEIIYYLEKQDITEEKVRLSSHLSYFLETINLKTPNGKKLGFITQEIGREINTIGSKSSDFEMQKIVVQMKDELEKIKEQILNIL